MKKTIELILLAVICVFALTGCTVLGTRYTYDHAGKYTAGGTKISQEVRNLDISWIDGNVEFRYHGESSVELSETSEKRMSADTELRWWLDGDTLRIQYCRAGKRLMGGLGKTLTVTLPEEIRLEEVVVKGLSCNLSMPSVNIKKAVLQIVSGDITVDGRVGNLRVDTVSGNVSYRASSPGPVKIVTVSGDVSCAVDGKPDLKIDTVTGFVGVSVQEGSGYTVKFSSVSGQMETVKEHRLGEDGKALIWGDGSGVIDIVTVSGGARLDQHN